MLRDGTFDNCQRRRAPHMAGKEPVATLKLSLHTLNLQIGVIDSLLEMSIQIGVFFRQNLIQILLIVDVLCGLVCPEAESSTSALHDDVRA